MPDDTCPDTTEANLRAEVERYRAVAINHTALLNTVAEARDKVTRQFEDELNETMQIGYLAMLAVYEAVLAKAEQLDATPDTSDDPSRGASTAGGDEYGAPLDPAVKPESVEDREGEV